MAIKTSKSKESLSDKAYRQLKAKILDNELHAGQQMIEAEVSELLNMSRTPTREAMLRIANEGLIELKPRHGMRIKPISVIDMQEIYEILTGIEATAAALCAKKGLTEDQLSLMRDAVEEMDQALLQDDLKRWARSDERFHRYLVEFSNNKRLNVLVGNFIEQSHRARMMTLKFRPKPTNSNKDHLNLVLAIEARDVEQARLIHHNHRDASGNMLIELLKKYGLDNI
ncbi:MAG: DNA-binding GntR family transcriptional regulator [Marinomonas primoryensis]|jgi:DNA-binding GntR family transcriptional regulator|tara:strand:+ start:8715 stop:9395 length:681 start_codon:yes stop_codon:yes gene_type:complete